MPVRAVDDKASDTLVVVFGKGFWTGSSTLPHLHHLAMDRVGRMIVRIWRGIASAERSDAYMAYFRETGLREYRATPGNRSVRVLTRPVDRGVEWAIVTTWDSWDAIRAFAGPAPERAVYYPDDAAYFVEMPELVDHYELIVAEGTDT